MLVEVDSPEALASFLERGGGLAGAVVQGLDLSAETARIVAAPAAGAVLLGCRLEPAALGHVVASGGLVFPRLGDLPYQPFRGQLYTVEELLAGYRPGDDASYWRDTLDGRVYAHFDGLRRAGPVPLLDTLAQRLHDHAVDDAVGDLLGDRQRPRRVVAIMGGHGQRRDEAAYLEVARLARSLTRRGYFVMTGGGPGAMEAGNLGAHLAPRPDPELERAVATLAAAPTFASSGFVDRALEVRGSVPSGGESLGVPTWFYGHEPTNVFATHVAKYFANSLREDGLLSLATHGVVYAPGSAGTIQEVFADAAQNHYGSLGTVSPMVFLGVDYWTRVKPVYPLLETLAAGRPYAGLLAVVDDAETAVEFLAGHPPLEVAPPVSRSLPPRGRPRRRPGL